MSVKPIDLQVNISQLPEVAKGEHGKTAALIEGRHALDKDAEEHAKSIKEKLEENKQAEKTVIMREEGFKKNKRNKESDKGTEEENLAETKKEVFPDEKKGTMIDLKR